MGGKTDSAADGDCVLAMCSGVCGRGHGSAYRIRGEVLSVRRDRGRVVLNLRRDMDMVVAEQNQ